MELNKKEKKAIDELKSKREYFEYYPEGCNWRLSFDEEEVHTIIDVIINLLEKQRKEIKELNKNKQQIVYEEIFTPDYIEENFINKDKIREKIKELKEIADEDNPDIFTKIDAYEELLEEKINVK